MSWRRINHVLHRDIGFLCIGMTLVYAISGVVLNHISHRFNPSYFIEHTGGAVQPLPADSAPGMELVSDILAQLDEKSPLKNVAMLAPGNVRIFVEGNTIDVELATGRVRQEKVIRRPLLYEVNFLHLNKGKGIWTYVADIYALLLGVLAVTGLLMIRGSIRSRGILLTLLGFLLPLVCLLIIT